MQSKQSESLLPEAAPAQLQHAISLESCDEAPQMNCDQVSYGDAVFATFIVAPLVVSHWRGTWGLMELQPEMFPYVQIYLLGIVIHICFALIRSQLFARAEGAYSKPEGGALRWCLERVLSRVYTYIFIQACVMHWRGGWGILDMFVEAILPDPEDPHRGVLIAAITLMFYLTATCIRSSRNFLAPPYFIVTDGKEETYIFSTRFRTSFASSKESLLYVLDCIFSVAVVGSLVVFVWRGSWALLDIYLFPDDLVKSCWTSLLGGYALVIVTFALQAPIRWVVARLHGAPRLLLADVYHFISFLATVNVWRGVWGLLDVYFFPETPKLSNWCSHIISLALLILLNCSNSVIVRGVYIDAEEPAGECVVFPCHYLRLFFHKERTKKRHKRILAAAAAAAKKPEEACLQLQMPDEKV